MAKGEDREPVAGRTQIHRLYEGDGGAQTAIGGMTREERAQKYRRDMAPTLDADVIEARGDLVRKLRKVAPDSSARPDTKFDRWYVAAEWSDDGRYIGDPPCVRPANPDPGVLEAATKAAQARDLLLAAENRVGVKHANLETETALNDAPGLTKKRGRPPKEKK